MATKPPPQSKTINLESAPDLEPTYANLARIAHSPADIVLEFGHLLPGGKKAKVAARVVMTPISAKLLLKALNENISRYETAYGEIRMPKSNTLADNLFRPFLKPDNDTDDKDK